MSNPSKWIGFVVGAIEIGIGIYTGNVALIVQGGLTIAAQAVVDLTMPKTPARQASEMEIALGEQPRSIFVGEGYTAGTLVDSFNYGGTYGTDWEVRIIRLADEPCEALVSFFVNTDTNDYVGDGFYPRYDDQLQLYFRADTSVDPLPAIVVDNGPGWSADYIGRSGCDVIVAYKADKPNDKHPGWPGGRPTFGFILKGGKRYDPRKDDTAGGSGSHRWEDRTTWEWSENPAVCRYNWARGIYADGAVTDPSALLVGRGLSAIEAPPENIFAAANLCDEAVGSGVRYRVAGPIYSNQDFIDVEQMFAIATAGSVITHEGDVQLEPGQSKSIVATITDDDVLVGSKVSYNNGFLSESSPDWVNSVTPTYVEPAQLWNSHQAPPARVTSDILSDGRPREASITLRLVKDLEQAQRIAEIQRRLGRLWGRVTLTLGPRFCQLEEGDCFAWQSDRYLNGGTLIFRIESYSLNEKWQITINGRQIDADVFDGVFAPPSDLSVVSPSPVPPSTGTPAAGQWALTPVTVSSGGVNVPALEITGSASDDTSVGAIIFEYWKSDGVIDPLTNPDDPPWTQWGGNAAPTTTKVDITGVTGGADYYAAVTYVVSGIPGDRKVLGPVTAATVDISGAVTTTATPLVEALPWKKAVRAKTATALAANTYANGTSGVGATLTAAASGALAAVDGVTLAANDRVLVDQEAIGSHNGIYVVTQIGDSTHPYILTRATDADSGSELVNATVKVNEGTNFADQEWQCTTNAMITVGTTALVWAEASGGGTVTIQDEGTAKGSATTMNFTGAGVTATVSGGVATVNIPGGGGSVELPGTIADLIIWIETDTILGTAGNPIGNLVNRTPWAGWPYGSITNAGAVIDAATLNGLPVLNFAGSTAGRYNAVSQVAAKLTKGTIFVVFQPNTVTGTSAFISGPTGALLFRLNLGVLGLVKDNVANIGASSSTLSAGTWYQANATYDSTTGAFAFRVGKTPAGGGTNVQSITAQSFALGYDNAGSSSDANCKIAAIIAYERVLTSAEIAEVEDYLSAKWGV